MIRVKEGAIRGTQMQGRSPSSSCTFAFKWNVSNVPNVSDDAFDSIKSTLYVPETRVRHA